MTPGPVAAASDEAVHLSKTLSKVLSVVHARPAALLVDLSPAIGSNISFLGERVGCKIHVGDLYADLDRHAREGTFDRLPEFLERRFSLSDESVDAVLCWDIFDYLGPAAGGVLARELIRLLRPGGLLLGFFGSRTSEEIRYTKYFIEDESRLRYRFYPSACRQRWVLQSRDIDNLFHGLQLSDSILMTSRLREVLFRKRESRPKVRSEPAGAFV
jgi:methyltransferase family protein